MWYAVELKNGLRQSEGVRDMGSEVAMEAFAESHMENSKKNWDNLGVPNSNGWTVIVVDEEGLKNLPMIGDGNA